MEQNILSQNRYNMLSNTLLSDYFKSETNMEVKIRKIYEQILKLTNIKNLSIIDKLIIYSILNNRAYNKYFNNSFDFQSTHNRLSTITTMFIIEDIESIDKATALQLYSYYTLKDIVGLFLNLLEIFITLNINLPLLNKNNIKENIALIMEVFQPTVKREVTINHSGLIKCAVALNVAKS